MAFESISPNMSLILPGVGQTLGPQYATDLNNSLTIIDGHNHTAGYGVPVPSSGLNINADLSMNNSNLIAIKSLRMTPQSILAGPSDLDCLFVNGVDLYYNDGVGNHVRITQSGGVAGSPGSISNLTSPASATYVAGSSTFVWQSAANTPANMDNASIILRNLVANSFGVTLNPPNAMASNYNLTLPTLPPGQQIMTLDASGNMAAPYTVDNVTLAIVSNVIQVKDTNVVTVTTNTTTTPAASDYLVDTTAGDITITLPTAVPSGKPIVVKKVSTDSNHVIIATTAGQTIDGVGSGTPKLSAVNDSFVLQSDGSNYVIVSRYLNPISAQINLTGNQTIPTSTDTLVAFTGASGTGVTFAGNAMTILYDGIYSIVGNLRYQTNGAGLRYLDLHVNTVTIVSDIESGIGLGVDNMLRVIAGRVGLLAGDVVTIHTQQASGGALDLVATNSNWNNCSVTRVGVIGGV